jgi:hypothetical protein
MIMGSTAREKVTKNKKITLKNFTPGADRYIIRR